MTETENTPTPEQASPERRCGFVALVGAPNAGKSTLINKLVGAKVAIVSPKVQTTRSRTLGLAIASASQIIFVDTPGIFTPRKRLERSMVKAAWAGAHDADVVVLLVDVERGIDRDTRQIIDGLKAAGRRAVLALNKIDLVKRDSLLALAETLAKEGIFDPVFMISGLSGSGVADLMDYLARSIPAGPWLYPEDEISDMPERLLASEVTREQVFLQLHDELPYASTVETEAWEEFKDGSVKISATIYVQRDSQKAIILGEGGKQIKRIGARARAELEKLMDRRVHLFLFVKVRENWTEDRERYDAMRLDFEE
ncbi:MAG: GTPase Era [Rhodospirillales bacterium]|nr:GTPase Era [Rhodospirillales bacterium]